MSQDRLDAAIRSGLAYIQSCQQPDGGFLTFVSKTEQPFRTVRNFTTTFTPALILSSLCPVDEAKPLRERIATWLLAQRNQNWSFNYWAKDVPERKTRTYPDDLDDTFCALFALWRHNPNSVNSVCLARVVRLLIASEKEVGGPYRTWLAPNSATNWQDVDLVVNCNVASFLQAVAEPLPKLTSMMDHAIRTKDFSSAYYLSEYAAWFFLARAYRGSLSKDLVKLIITKRRNGHWGTPGQTALALLALRYLGYSDKRQDWTVKYLLGAQLADGSWPAEAFWLDEAKGSIKHFAGSDALTTAVILEALAVHASAKSEATIPKTSTSYAEVMEYVEMQTNTLESPLREEMNAMIRHMRVGDANHEIALLPHIFADSAARLSASDDTLVRLGGANFFGWLAYTIYDDFLDDEGDTKRLSAANVALRRSLACFRHAMPHHAVFLQLVDQTFDRIDTANAWELQHCRFKVDGNNIWLEKLPHYRSFARLADRSCGHLLTPLAVVANAGIALDGPQVTLLRKGLTCYLVARQLNDDMHDWKGDIQKGHISYVVATILNDLNLPPGKQILAELLPKMEHEFWHHSLKKLCKATLRQVTEARKAYTQTSMLKKDSPLFALLDGLEASMDRTLKEQERATAFLAAYKAK